MLCEHPRLQPRVKGAIVSDLAVGVVLAAGAGTRYGSPKVLAHDGLWLKTAVQALRNGGCDRVVVVLGAADAP
ncbi:MAG: NTP transferase domain-containing protein, partial [Rhodococcus sp. (in: high G+C Gram-positive bacteria)]